MWTLLVKLKWDTYENTTFCHSARQWLRSRAYCSLRRYWFLDNASRRNSVRATSPVLKRHATNRWRGQFQTRCSIPTTPQHREDVRSITAMRRKWRPFSTVFPLNLPFGVRPSSIHWFHNKALSYEPKCHDMTSCRETILFPLKSLTWW